jgi:hypothetical protein
MREKIYIIRTQKRANFRATMKKLTQDLESLSGEKYEVVIRNPRRTPAQARSIRLFDQWVADALNDIGEPYYLRIFAFKSETRWTPELVHEALWKPIMYKQFKKTSTTQLTTSEVSQVADIIIDLLATKEIIIRFPSIDQLHLETYEQI